MLCIYHSADHDGKGSAAIVKYANKGCELLGFNYDQETDTYLISGYMADGSASRIYRVKGSNGESQGYVNLKDGERLHEGHMGGITSFGDTIWISSDDKVYRANKTEIILKESGTSVNSIDCFDPKNNSSFITTFNGKLCVGEFYRSGNYETAESHYLKIDDKTTNNGRDFSINLFFTSSPKSNKNCLCGRHSDFNHNDCCGGFPPHFPYLLQNATHNLFNCEKYLFVI
jgi:hypothetical protein